MTSTMHFRIYNCLLLIGLYEVPCTEAIVGAFTDVTSLNLLALPTKATLEKVYIVEKSSCPPGSFKYYSICRECRNCARLGRVVDTPCTATENTVCGLCAEGYKNVHHVGIVEGNLDVLQCTKVQDTPSTTKTKTVNPEDLKTGVRRKYNSSQAIRNTNSNRDVHVHQEALIRWQEAVLISLTACVLVVCICVVLIFVNRRRSARSRSVLMRSAPELLPAPNSHLPDIIGDLQYKSEKQQCSADIANQSLLCYPPKCDTELHLESGKRWSVINTSDWDEEDAIKQNSRNLYKLYLTTI